MTDRPRGLFGPNYDGLLDPERITAQERLRTGQARLIEERRRRSSLSPVVRALQAATDRAFRGAR